MFTVFFRFNNRIIPNSRITRVQSMALEVPRLFDLKKIIFGSENPQCPFSNRVGKLELMSVHGMYGWMCHPSVKEEANSAKELFFDTMIYKANLVLDGDEKAKEEMGDDKANNAVPIPFPANTTVLIRRTGGYISKAQLDSCAYWSDTYCDWVFSVHINSKATKWVRVQDVWEDNREQLDKLWIENEKITSFWKRVLK